MPRGPARAAAAAARGKLTRQTGPKGLESTAPEGRAIAAAQAGEESPGSTETTVPDNVRRAGPWAGSGKVPQREDRPRPRPGERGKGAVRAHRADGNGRDRKSVVEGKSVSVRVDLGGRRLITQKNKHDRTKGEQRGTKTKSTK